MSREGAAAIIKRMASIYPSTIGAMKDSEGMIRLTEALQSALDAAYAEGLREAAKVLDKARVEIEKDWSEDEAIPKGEHESADCQSACDMYCYAHNTLGLLASEIERLAQRKEGRDERTTSNSI